MPSKRRSIEDNEDDQDDELIVEKDDDEEEEMEEESAGVNGEEVENEAPNVQEEDGMDEHEQENDEAVVTPPSAKRRRHESPPRSAPRALNRPGEVAQVGIIQQILVENFMCHRKLRVDLCRNINFIHGQNGSGKSAILAAIQICLGAGARRTHRAANLKAMVRQDHVNPPTHAKISVTLRNEGQDAFRGELFGRKITVERTISLRSGGFNGYKLYDQNMKEVSKSRKDLDDMLDHLNIQVENPVAILDQEESKKFLTGKATDKYNFFMNACELERLDRSYATIVDNLQDCEKAKERIAAGLQMEQEKVDELKKKYDQHRELAKLETKLLADQTKFAWALWKEHKLELEAAEKKMQSFEEKAAKKREELSQAEILSQKSTEGQDELSARIEELMNEAAQISDKKKQLEAERKEAMVPLRQQEQKVKQLDRKEKQAKKELQAAQQRLQETLTEIASKNKENEKGRLAAALAEREEKLAAARQKEDGLKQEVADKYRLHEGLEPQVKDARRAHQELENKIRNSASRLEDMEKSSGDTLAMFGRNVKKVKAEIDRRKKDFRGPVLGPIGAYIKIEPGKEDFAALAESTLGPGTLDRFIVTNNHDRQIVQQIRNRAGCRQDCGIFQMSAGRGRFSVPPPPGNGIETAASVLKIENDLVFNCLVDNCRIDQNALARDLLKSQQALIKTDDTGNKAMKGIIKQVFCLPKGDMWNLKNGQMAVISNERQLTGTIGNDKTAAITNLKREMEQLQSEAKAARREADRLEGQHAEYVRNWNAARRAMRDNDKIMQDLDGQIETIKEKLDQSEDTIDTTEYEEDVAQQSEHVKKYADDKQRELEALEQMKPKVEELQKEIRDLQSQSEKAVADLAAAEGEMTKFLETQSQRKDVVARKREKVQQYEQAMAIHSAKVEAAQEEVTGHLVTARKLQFRLNQKKEKENDPLGEQSTPDEDGPAAPTREELESMEPVQVEKDPEYYQGRVSRTQKKIENERENRKLNDEDETEAYQKWTEAKRLCSEKLDELSKIDDTISDYSDDLKRRRKLWKKFRSYLGDKTGEKFQELLLMNKYAGDLNFDHEAKQLTLNVRKQSSAASQSNDVKGLSGGERSYTTIALLIALGEYLETPFRVMDEFDVFLDPQVRKFVIKALIHTAKEMQHRQFIFITPQDLSGIDQDPQLKIFKLNPPERYNTVGPSQQTLNLSQA